MVGDQAFARQLGAYALADADIRTDPHPHVTRVRRYQFIEGIAGRRLEVQYYLGWRDRKLLACADVDWYPSLSSGVEEPLHRDEGFLLRPRPDPRYGRVTLILTAHQMGRVGRADGVQQRSLRVAHRLVLFSGRWVHGQVGEHLKQVVLHHAANRARLVIEAAAICNAVILRHGDLNAANVVAIPGRLDRRIGKAGVGDVLHRLFAKVMIDAVDILFCEMLLQELHQRAGRLAAVPDWLLDHKTRVAGTTLSGERIGDGPEHAGRYREMVQRPLGAAQVRASPLERVKIGIVAADVA
jgi:hypothetical protein